MAIDYPDYNPYRFPHHVGELTTEAASAAGTIGAGVEKNVLSVNGSGESLVISLYVEFETVIFRIWVDGHVLKLVYALENITANLLNILGYTASTPGIQLLAYTSGVKGPNYIQITLRIAWRSKITIQMSNPTGTDYDYRVAINYIKRVT